MGHEIDPGQSGVEEPVPTDAARRAALRKLGIYGAFTAPVLMGLLKADAAVAASPIGDPIHGECTTDPPNCEFT